MNIYTLAAKCILDESGHVFTKMKRATRIATDGLLHWPSDSGMLKLKEAKDIGVKPKIMPNGGRYNKLVDIHKRYFLSQPFMQKVGDIFFEDPEDNNEVKILGVFQNDGAEMCMDKNALLGMEMFVGASYGNDLQGMRYFEDPSIAIDCVMVDGQEELTLIHSMLKHVYLDYNPEQTYDVICGLNEYSETEGLFPKSLCNEKRRQCVLCTKYSMKDSCIMRRNAENTRNIWVHPGRKVVVVSGADTKNLRYQQNLKASYCRICKCCHGKKGDSGGWCKALVEGISYEGRSYEEMCNASDERVKLYTKFERDLFLGKVPIPEGSSEPRSNAERYQFFKTTEMYTKDFKPRYPEYRACLPLRDIDAPKIVDDMLHAKLHFTEFACGFLTPLVEIAEDIMEGHALVQYQAGLEDNGLSHIAKRVSYELSKLSTKPKTRKELLVEGVKTASYVSFLSQKSRSKKDLEERLRNVLKKHEQLLASNAAPEAQIPDALIERCEHLLNCNPAASKEVLLECLVQIAQNRHTSFYSSAFLGGVMTVEEITRVKDS